MDTDCLEQSVEKFMPKDIAEGSGTIRRGKDTSMIIITIRKMVNQPEI